MESGPCIAVQRHGLSYIPSTEQKWDANVFMGDFQVDVTSFNQETIEFDLINIDCTFANAIRRILLAEVPSIAIDRVYLYQNTSVIPDETFCHRLGLLPLNVDPDLMSYSSAEVPHTDELDGFDPNSHLIFDLNIKNETSSTEKSSENQTADIRPPLPIYSKSLIWVPLPGQKDAFQADGTCEPAPVNNKVLLNKLAPGDEIMARCLAIKGIGRDHAKFTPVSNASYKLLPSIQINGSVCGDLAKKLQKCFAKGVIDLDPKTQIASVANARLDNGSREHFRHPDLANIVNISLNPRHFIFTVETVAPGYRPPDTLVKSAIDIMLSKCSHYINIVEKPGFAAIPLCDTNNGPEELDGGERTRASLNGRLVGLDVAFVSNDLRRATFRFTGEDHTLGAALRYCILRSDTVNLCGYCQPHPLEDTITFEIQSKGEVAARVLREGLYCLRACFEHIKRKFKSAMRKAQKQLPKPTPG